MRVLTGLEAAANVVYETRVTGMEARVRLSVQRRGGEAEAEGRSLESSSEIDIQHTSIFTSHICCYANCLRSKTR